MILAGDLGGTKTLLALAEPGDGRPRIVLSRRYASADFACFDDLLARFLAESAGDGPAALSPIVAACFGVAGPTNGCQAKLTYLPWQLDAAALARRFGFGRVTLLNDFAATACGLALVEPHERLVLQAGQPLAEAPRVVLGAGTGLGVAGLLATGGGWRVIPGEGGHLGFSPQTAEQGELWRWLLAQNGRVTTEDLVSGPGLARIYAFLGGRPQQPDEIGAAALAGHDRRAVEALRLWLACYGAFAGDLALLWLARGGIFLAGGIAAKLLPHCDPAPLLAAFLAKREHQPLLAAMPLSVIIAEDLGLRGALCEAARPVTG